MTLNNDEEFRFIFDDNSELLVPKNCIVEISPSFYYKNIKNEKNIIKMPKYISQKDLNNFIEVFQKYISRLRQFNFDQSFISIKLLLEGNTTNISKLIQISELFENNSFSIILIKDCLLNSNKGNENINNIEHMLNIDNVIILLYLSYNKLKEINNKEKINIFNKHSNNNNIEAELETTWLDLFIKSLDMIGNNLNYYFETNKSDNVINNKLWGFDKKIIDELYEKFSLNLIVKNFKININEIEFDSNINQNFIDLKDLNKIINFLIKKRNQNDFFSLLSNEFMKIISEENINEINSLPNPTFILKININDINNYYEEYPINNSFNMNDGLKIIIVVYYKKNEDTFNVALKLSKDKNIKIRTSFDIITFLTLSVIEEIDNKQINVKSLFNNKSMYEILKITNFKKVISSKKDKIGILAGNEYLTLKLFLKPCFIYTMLCNYLFYNLENLYNDKNIFKLSKNLLNIIITKKQLYKNDENDSFNIDIIKNNNVDKIVICLINWLNDEVNIGEDISEIIKNIRWDYVSLPLLFEFLIKYSIHIISEDIEYIFSKSLSKILNQFDNDINIISKEIIHSIIKSSKKLNYMSIFCENKKIKKFNLYDLMNKRRNILMQIEKKSNENNNNHKNSNIFDIQKIVNNRFTIISTKSQLKDNFRNFKKNEINPKSKIKIGNFNTSIDNKLLRNAKNKNNISFHNNSDIYYNNFFNKCHNNFNINIYKNKSNNNNKIKNIFPNKRKFIISQIKKRENNNIKNINLNINTINSNKNSKNNTPESHSPRKYKLNKLNSNNILNKTINFKNLKNLDKQLMKNKFERNKNKSSHNSNKNKLNFSKIKNKTYINQRYSYINYKKNNHQKNNFESIENDCSKKDKNRTHISLLNELLKFNKKRKKNNKLEIKRNNNDQSLNTKRLNLTQINIEEKSTKENFQ